MCNPNPRSSHNQASSSSSTSTTSIPASASAPRASSFPASRIRMEPPSPASTSATGVVVVSASGTTMTSSSSSSSSSAGNGDPSRKLRKRPVAASAHQRTESRDEEFVPHGAMALSSSSSAGGEEDDSPPQQEQQQQQRSQVPSPLPLPLQQRPAEQQPPQPPQPPQWYEEEDEIPCLVDEDGEEPRPQHGTSTSTSTTTTTTTNTARWPRRYSEPHHHRKDNNNVSVDVGAHPTTTPPPTLPRLHRSRSDVPKSHGADANVHCADPKQLPQPQPQPFFVLDWMLDELVPEDRTAHDLAALFRHSSALDRTPPSPMVQHFLPWLWNNTKEDDNSRAAAATATASSRNTNENENENENGIGNQMPSVGRTARAMTRLAYYETPIRERERPSTPIRSNERPCPCASPPSSPVAATMDPARVAGPPLLLTPKSSNRRACRMRQRLARQRNQQRVEEWCSDNDNDNDHGNNDEEGVADGSFEIGPGLLLPMNLDRKLQDTEEKAPSVAARAGSQAEADEDEAEDEASAGALPPVQRRRILFPWMPSSTSTPTSPLSGGGETKRNDNDNGTTNNHDVDKGEPNARSPARKSASCPQFADGTASDPEERLRKEQLQKRRRQEQIDRRERRQKLTIVQRSLTMAKGWNTKGLDMAGKAIRAEQKERERERALDDVQMHMRMKMHMHMPDDPDKAASEGSPSATAHEANAPPNPERLWGSALVCWNNALEVYRSLLGPSHERVADVQNNRGIALGKLRRFGEALEALGMALEARKTQQRKRAAKEASSQQHQQHQHQRGDDGPVGVGNQNQNIASPRHSNEAAASTTEAIVSTLHNISNVHRDACEPRLALEALFEAQKVLRTCTTNANTNTNEASSPSCQDQQYHEWHQSARLSTAIGHVCYESESWWDARDAYGEALQVYQRLSRALARESELVESGVNNPERLEWLRQQWESIQRDVSVLEYDLDELDLRQQAEAGSRTLLLRARRQEQQQQHQQQRRWSPHRQRSAPLSSPAQSGQEPSSSDGTKTILGFVSHLRT